MESVISTQLNIMKTPKIAFFVCLLFLMVRCEDDDLKKNTGKVLLPVDVAMDTLMESMPQIPNPWSIEELSPGKWIIAGRNGKMHIYQSGILAEVSGVPAVITTGQAGLMDIELHPQFQNNKKLYFTAVTGTSSNYSTTLYSANLNGQVLSEVEKLFQAEPRTSSSAHFGSRIVLDGQGFLYLCIGERNDPTKAQDLSLHSGKVIRLFEDGKIPPDNPWVDSLGKRAEIWTYGHRNPQGMAKNPWTGEIWVHEHGPKGGDEINILKKASNYGWPLATYGVNYDGSTITPDTFVEGTILPIYYYKPSIAPCGMTFYHSEVIPQWNGSLFLGALAGEHLNHLTIQGNRVIEEERLVEGIGRIRDVKQGSDGFLYFVTETPGAFYRFRPKS